MDVKMFFGRIEAKTIYKYIFGLGGQCVRVLFD